MTLNTALIELHREIGIHMAIGATPANVTQLFIADGLKVYLAGLLLGLALMLAAAPFLEPLLYQTAVMDVGVYLLSTLVLTLAVLGAIYLPASQPASQQGRCHEPDYGAAW